VVASDNRLHHAHCTVQVWTRHIDSVQNVRATGRLAHNLRQLRALDYVSIGQLVDVARNGYNFNNNRTSSVIAFKCISLNIIRLTYVKIFYSPLKRTWSGDYV